MRVVDTAKLIDSDVVRVWLRVSVLVIVMVVEKVRVSDGLGVV